MESLVIDQAVTQYEGNAQETVTESESESFSLGPTSRYHSRKAIDANATAGKDSSLASSYEDDGEQGDKIDPNLAIEFMPSSKRFNGRMRNKINTPDRRNTEIKKIMFSNYVTEGLGKRVSMPFSLVRNNNQKDKLKAKEVEIGCQDALNKKIKYLIDPYNKNILNHSSIEYKNREERHFDISEFANDLQTNRDLGRISLYLVTTFANV